MFTQPRCAAPVAEPRLSGSPPSARTFVCNSAAPSAQRLAVSSNIDFSCVSLTALAQVLNPCSPSLLVSMSSFIVEITSFLSIAYSSRANWEGFARVRAREVVGWFLCRHRKCKYADMKSTRCQLGGSESDCGALPQRSSSALLARDLGPQQMFCLSRILPRKRFAGQRLAAICHQRPARSSISVKLSINSVALVCSRLVSGARLLGAFHGWLKNTVQSTEDSNKTESHFFLRNQRVVRGLYPRTLTNETALLMGGSATARGLEVGDDHYRRRADNVRCCFSRFGVGGFCRRR